MRRLLLLLLMGGSLRMAAAALSTVEGQVTMSGGALPGCTVRLDSPTSTRTAVSGADGRYRFEGVAEGEYEIHFELEGAAEPARQRAIVRGELMTIPVQDLSLAMTEAIVFTCGWPCTPDTPSGRFDRPRCSEYELHDALIESAGAGDASSVEFLQSRYATAETLSERQRLGGALLRKVPNDQEIWNELASQADIALRFPYIDGAPSPEFLQLCVERDVDPHSYWWMAKNALEVAGKDPRSHALLLRALATNDDTLVYTAIQGLAQQHDVGSLPLIDAAIVRLPDHTRVLALALAYFRDERADALAMKYLEDESSREQYQEWRAEAIDDRR